MIFKPTVLIITILILFCISPLANAKSKQVAEKKDKSKVKEVLVFESCDKAGDDKCKKETATPIPDHSKYLK